MAPNMNPWVDPFWKTKKGIALEASRKQVPRYLYRVYSAESGGGLKGLNTPSAIIPHAFLNGICHNHIHQVPLDHLRTMIKGHLDWEWNKDKTVLSGFSSWAASIPLVLQYGLYKITDKESDINICVIDTHKLKNVSIYHVNSMDAARVFDKCYEWEYLAYGVITGEGFKVVPLPRLKSAGLCNWLPEIKVARTGPSLSWWLYTPGYESGKDNRQIFPIAYKEVAALTKVAAEFGDEFIVPVLVALVTTKRRKVDCNGKFSREDTQTILKALDDGIGVHHKDGMEKSMFVKGVYTTRYPHIAQMGALFKALVAYQLPEARQSVQVLGQNQRPSSESIRTAFLKIVQKFSGIGRSNKKTGIVQSMPAEAGKLQS